jgi:hypothetical protein
MVKSSLSISINSCFRFEIIEIVKCIGEEKWKTQLECSFEMFL